MVDPEKLELGGGSSAVGGFIGGGSSAVGGFIGEMQLPVTGKLSLSFPQDDTACICKRLSWVTK